MIKKIIEDIKNKSNCGILPSTTVPADLYNSDYIVIDMNEKRKGKCYKAFWDSYPDEGDTPTISLSFTELLEKLSQNDGEYWFFLKKDFMSYGDAYAET